ncbi:MAG: hypothetical protein H6512_00130 [Acidimicrobiia bacterium]|nr:hypothetical protein [Acidimicrobiia bacterium]
MTVRAKLATYALVLAASFGVGAAIGAAVGPIHFDEKPVHAEHDDSATSPENRETPDAEDDKVAPHGQTTEHDRIVEQALTSEGSLDDRPAATFAQPTTPDRRTDR